MQLGKVIHYLRKKRSLNQKEFAKKIGKTASYLSLIESNQKIPSMELMRRISKELEIPFYYLIYKSLDVETEIPQNKRDTYNHLSPVLDKIIEDIFFDENTTLKTG